MSVLASRRIAFTLAALFTLQGFPLAASSAASDGFAFKPSLNNEGPFIGGVFSRPAGPPLQLPPRLEEFEPPVLFDKAGNSNRVFVMLDFNDNIFDTLLPGKSVVGKRIEAEEAMLEAINARSAMTEAYFAKPDKAHYLIRPGDRLDAEARALLDANDPGERLQRYIILSYPTVGAALAAAKQLNQLKGVLLAGVDKRLEFSAAPNDPYFPINASGAARYQWGMHAMNFPLAWDRSTGHGYVGVADGGLVNGEAPSDISGGGSIIGNFREHFSFQTVNPALNAQGHGTHVLGIVGAIGNNSQGVIGGCPTCSASMAHLNMTGSSIADAIYGLTWRGMQVINFSFGGDANTVNCISMAPVCDAIAVADQRDTLIVAAAGNFNRKYPDFPANQPSVLSVGGIQNTNPVSPGSWAPWSYDSENGSNYAGLSGIVAPARSIVSTMPPNWTHNPNPQYLCSDASGIDESGVAGDGYGSCTGTSMSAPHASALAGIVRSVNPRLTRDSIKNLIRSSGSHYSFQTSQLGAGLPNARLAVDLAIAQTPRRLTPLFSMYSGERLDYF